MMIDLNSTQRSNENLSTTNSANNTKAELDNAKLAKGTELAGREPIDIERQSKTEQKDKKDLIAEVKQNLEKLKKNADKLKQNV